MAARIRFNTIAPFLSSNENRCSRWLGYAGLCMGVFLLLCSVQMFININQLLSEKDTNSGGFDFISITKTITNENMGSDNRFQPGDIEELRSQPFVEDAAPLISNQFRAKASAGNIVPFSTELFLETITPEFLDTLPPNFTWQPGETTVPIIFSADLLEMYNIFAPTQDLPQLSAQTVTALNIILECYGPLGMEMFRGRIVGLSHRISSVIVPETFLSWANKRYGEPVNHTLPSRVYIKTKDANDPAFLKYIESKGYYVNKDKTRLGRIRQILEGIVTGLGAFSILVIILSMVLFSFYLQLMVARNRDNLVLLKTIGYSPSWLTRTVSGKWIPVYITIVTLALLLSAAVQFFFYQSVPLLTSSLKPYPSLIVLLLAVLIIALCIYLNHRLIRKLLLRL